MKHFYNFKGKLSSTLYSVIIKNSIFFPEDSLTVPGSYNVFNKYVLNK